MPYLVALLIFVALSAACWFVSVALYQNTLNDTTLTASPDFTTTTALSVGVAALTSFIPFPGVHRRATPMMAWSVQSSGRSSIHCLRSPMRDDQVMGE
ncbi:hypothetical protein [Gemmata sp.]|uniref:hypothetical protein n=1 Tax=Gemmata sp. TaxID=1914242 RepID=UPI003F71DD09